MSHSCSLTSFRSARSLATSFTAAGCAIQVFSSAGSSLRTLASLAASPMRSALISRMVILSISSPIDTGVRMASTWLVPGNRPA
ncbi:hypothetical protein G6F46_015809 [Rhizopus delemar]|nr:hypothetical protein G6F46_015809 [Rhizopus delemar]